jgi:hypothetical protein
MPVHFPAEATCDHCGKTAPCKLDCAFLSGVTFGGRSFKGFGAAIRGLEFFNHDALACSDACRDALAKDPRWRWADFGNRWGSCGGDASVAMKSGSSSPAADLPTFCGACGWRVTPAEVVHLTPSILGCPQCGTPLSRARRRRERRAALTRPLHRSTGHIAVPKEVHTLGLQGAGDAAARQICRLPRLVRKPAEGALLQGSRPSSCAAKVAWSSTCLGPMSGALPCRR